MTTREKSYKSDVELRELMGKYVRVVRALSRHVNYRNGMVIWITVDWKSDGWIVGHRFKKNGKIHRGDFESGGYFEMSSLVPCLMVALHPREKPIYVPYDGYELIDDKGDDK